MKAFPFVMPEYAGMDLRDYFAAKAMQSLVCEETGKDNDSDWEEEIKTLSEMSYSIADAMMKAREQ